MGVIEEDTQLQPLTSTNVHDNLHVDTHTYTLIKPGFYPQKLSVDPWATCTCDGEKLLKHQVGKMLLYPPPSQASLRDDK